MRWFSRLLYKLLGVYTTINIVNTKHEIIKSNVKIKFIPQPNDLVYFKENGEYYIVVKVLHFIKDRHEIWVVTNKFTNNT